MFAASAAAGIAAAASFLPRLDAVIFTGGIGEHAGLLRARIVGRLGVLGVAPIDDGETGRDRVLTAGPPAVVRVEAREDLVMARAATALLAAPTTEAPLNAVAELPAQLPRFRRCCATNAAAWARRSRLSFPRIELT